MPNYLEKYTTEYNYLFSKIYNMAHHTESSLSEDLSYSFGNNLRRFLEVHLFFKFPNQNKHEDKIRAFFNHDLLPANLTIRLTNEFSHFEEIFDRSMKVIDLDENKKLAQFILDVLKANDEPQFNALVEACN